jgi:HAMP domain-containing protein
VRFRNRLVLFLIATLAIVQALTAVAVYGFTRRALIVEGKGQLTQSAGVFLRQLDSMADQAAERVRILALDYALRSAIAERDRQTVVSALRNHGHRAGASRMQLVELDGAISADTEEGAAPGQTFADAELLERAADGAAAVIGAADKRAYWLIAVPVLAPVPIAFVVAEVPLDDALLAHLRELSSLPSAIELVVGGPNQRAVVAASSSLPSLVGQVPMDGTPLAPEADLVEVADREFLMLATKLPTADAAAPIVAVFGYPLDEALRPYRQVLIALGGLLAIGLVGALFGAVLIARGVSRPVELLARQVRRIEAGDYAAAAPPVVQRDEIGELAVSFAKMAQAIAEREERIQHQASHDAVTGLPNRAAIESLIGMRLVTRPDEPGALLSVGLERLHEVIKTVGHELGDNLLCDAARRLRLALPDHPVGRVSDISFAI